MERKDVANALEKGGGGTNSTYLLCILPFPCQYPRKEKLKFKISGSRCSTKSDMSSGDIKYENFSQSTRITLLGNMPPMTTTAGGSLSERTSVRLSREATEASRV